MAASAAVHAFGTLLKIGDGGGSEAFTSVGEVTDLAGPGFSADPIEVTHHGSPSGFREYIYGLLDGGEITLNISFVQADNTHNYSNGILKDYYNKTRRNYQIVLAGGSPTWTIKCLVTNFNMKEPIDDRLNADITLKLTGAPTLA